MFYVLFRSGRDSSDSSSPMCVSASYETCFMSYMNGWFNVGLVQGHVLYYVLYEPHDCMQCNPITIILTLKI